MENKKRKAKQAEPIVVILKGVNLQDIVSNYLNIVYPKRCVNDRFDEVDDERINEIINDPTKKGTTCFLDQRKTKIKYWAIMYDYHLNGPLPALTDRCCWWDRHPFTTSPLGCPIRYHPHRKLTAGLENTSYDIETKRIIDKLSEYNIPKNTQTNFFETEGVFCSMCCVQSYISEMIKMYPTKYKDSSILLTHMHLIFFGMLVSIPLAPTWKVLKPYGGHLTIEEYRSTFCKITYNETVNMRRPYMFCSSSYIEEKKRNIRLG